MGGWVEILSNCHRLFSVAFPKDHPHSHFCHEPGPHQPAHPPDTPLRPGSLDGIRLLLPMVTFLSISIFTFPDRPLTGFFFLNFHPLQLPCLLELLKVVYVITSFSNKTQGLQGLYYYFMVTFYLYFIFARMHVSFKEMFLVAGYGDACL